MFKTDTTINDTLYKNVYQSFKQIDEYSLIGQIREDVEDKIYFRPINYNKEFLLYDFSLAVGDSTTIIYWSSIDEKALTLIKIRIDSIVPITLNESNRLKYYISSKSQFENKWLSTNTWVSGIGDLEGVLYSCHNIDVGGIDLKQLLCYSLADSLIFINPSYQTCYIETTAINNQEIGNVLYYNNTLKTLVFEIDCISPIELIIVDTMGRVVLTKKLNTYQNNIDLSFLPNSFYMVNISGTNYQNNLKFFKK
ncbi:MAG TPA: hypothetical protein PK984_02170 [Paludibacteraceae bacterium]|nr:hypothetical protein [Paludibacteraceae bacterium]HOO24108.1 hypothetical protein [Paludibacteraceae bacterium]HOS37006.1 hypothetical protein [Paludibacteraceae bacterium]HPB84629.1 hypothetical protein [Paludibacteraceae bacterium]HPD26773.1 hypothetical protein [Paludibacteraceae bacterium]